MATGEAVGTKETRQFDPRLGLFTATAIVVGSMIGSGIFTAPSIMAEWVQSPGVLLGLWIFGGVFTLLGALSYGELAAMMPRAGGQYVFLREAFGRFPAFLFGWTLFLVIQTGFVAAVSIAFAKFLGVFLPDLAEEHKLLTVPLGASFPALQGAAIPDFLQKFELNTAQLVACGVIVLLTVVNILGVREGAWVQNLFTVLKVAALAALIVFGFYEAPNVRANFAHFLELMPGPKSLQVGLLAGLAVALSKALFAYDAWNSATFVAEEVREPARTLPRALLLGTLVTMAVYVLTTAAYIANVPLPEMAEVAENRIAHAVALKLFGNLGVTLVVIAILISTFGCVNGLILSGARVCYAMAHDHTFFRSCAYLHPERKTPVWALLYQGVWSCILALTGSFNALLTYTTFASVAFGAVTVYAVYHLRFAQPDRPRPYRCLGYPITPGLYLLIAIPFLIYVVQGDPYSTAIGALLVLTGVPFFFWFNRTRPS
jgi:APA family basic amino acid/polyamine antiporter